MRTSNRPTLALAAVAALAFTACSSDDGGAGTTDGGASAGVTIVAGDLFFEREGTSTADGGDLTVPVGTGEVTLSLDNQGVVLHNIVIEELSDEKVAEAQGGATDSGTVTLEAGTYTFYCDVAGHRDAGMEGTLQAG